MIDERLSEFLTRALDDDLDPGERADFDRMLEGDPALAAEFDALNRLRRAVGRAAEEMEPPAALDAVMKPMRLSPPPRPRQVGPVYRWLGAAAALVLGITVTLEVSRRHPEPDLATRPRHTVINHDEREIFELAPLPSAVPDADRPLGAADRLAQETPENPTAPEPQPLEIIGPLTDDEHAAAASSSPGAPETEEAATSTMTPALSAAAPLPAKEPAVKSTGAVVGDLVPPQRQTANSGGKGRHVEIEAARSAPGGRAGAEDVAASAHRETAPVVVSLAGEEIWSGRCTGCDASRWRLVLVVENGRVVATERAAEDGEMITPDGCVLVDIIGAALAGLEDGRHTAEAAR